MGPLTSSDVAGAVLVGLAAAVLGVLTLVAVVLVRSARAQRAQLAAELDRSRSEVESLGRRVEALTEDVHRAGRVAARDREYVITSLADVERGELPGRLMPGRPPVAQTLESQLVDSLARAQGGSAVRARAVDLVVRTVSLSHGVRRALSPDNIDRAAAEAHIARRRSRRIRKRELREARRLLRVVRDHHEDVA